MLAIRLGALLAAPGLQQAVVSAIRDGKVIVYPTDTVYGIGCDAQNREALARLRMVTKKTHPLSVIAPSSAWIRKHTNANPEQLKRLPGPYTLLVRKKKPAFLSAVARGKTLGVRIPAHPMAKVVTLAGVPLVTTSANVHGKKTMRTVAEFPAPFRKGVSLVIDGGTLKGPASRIIDLTGNGPKEIR